MWRHNAPADRRDDVGGEPRGRGGAALQGCARAKHSPSLQEMASDELKEIRKAMTKEAIREHQMARTGGTQTDLFTCGKCRKKNCTYTQVGGGPAILSGARASGRHTGAHTCPQLCRLESFPLRLDTYSVRGARAGAQARE